MKNSKGRYNGAKTKMAGYIALLIYTISCKFLTDVVDSYEMYDEVVHTPI